MSYFLALSLDHGTAILSRYQRLRSEGLLCDVVLIAADGERFPAHRGLLASSSDYFWSMFQDHTHESRARSVKLPAVSSAGLSRVLDLVYTSWLSLSPSTLEDTLEAASYLQVTAALDLCTRYISDNLSPGNCCFLANLAARYGVREALAAANDFIGIHLGELLEPGGDRAGLLELNLDSLQEALAAEEMAGVSELALLHLVLDWLDANQPPGVKSDLLLSKVRFGLVPPESLEQLSSVQLALQRPFIRSLVLKALHYHSQGPRRPLLQSTQTSLRVRDPQVLLVGGSSEPGRPQRRILAFDSALRRFRHLTDLPHTVRLHSVCVVGDFLFVLGGEVAGVGDREKQAAAVGASSEVWRYDPRCGHWEAATPMTEQRAQFSCCVVEGTIYAVGGRSGEGPALASVESYDMRWDRWRKGPALPRGIYGQACAVYQGGFYLSGGAHGDRRESSSADMYHLDPRQGRWAKCAAMSIARFGHQMATLGDKIYAFLGMYEPFCEIERFHPALNEWTRLRPLLSGRFCYGLAPLAGTVLLVGGRKWRDAREEATPSVLEYDPESDSWREVCKLPEPLSGMQCAVMQVPLPLET